MLKYAPSTMTLPSPAAKAPTPEHRRDIERWFARRGVPQLIEGFSSESAMDRRAAPLISLWLILGTLLWWGTRPDWPLLANLAGVVATVGWMAVVWMVVSRLRHRIVANPAVDVRPARHPHDRVPAGPAGCADRR